jgi:hypothetical protein
LEGDEVFSVCREFRFASLHLILEVSIRDWLVVIDIVIEVSVSVLHILHYDVTHIVLDGIAGVEVADVEVVVVITDVFNEFHIFRGLRKHFTNSLEKSQLGLPGEENRGVFEADEGVGGGIPIVPGVKVNLLVHLEATQLLHHIIHISVVVLPITVHIDLDFVEDECVGANGVHFIVRAILFELGSRLLDDFFCVCHFLFPFDYNTKIRENPDIFPGSALPVFRFDILVANLDTVAFDSVVEKRKAEFAVNALEDGDGVHILIFFPGEGQGDTIFCIACDSQSITIEFLVELHILSCLITLQR